MGAGAAGPGYDYGYQQQQAGTVQYPGSSILLT
jgi:hypothetical protein